MMLTRHSNTRYAAVRKLMALPLAAGLIFAVSCTQREADLTQKDVELTAAEKEYVNSPNRELFTSVEHPPMFPGGDEALNKYLSENIKYPHDATENNVQGTIFVQFVIRYDGTITDVKTVNKKIGSGLEEESIRVVEKMPKWKPGVQNDRRVDVQFMLPIRYTLQDGHDDRTSFWPGQAPFIPGQQTDC